jgi:hypothetical protein
MASKSVFRLQFNRLEVLNVLWIEEHVPNSRFLFVDAQWVPRKNDSLQDHFHRIRWQNDSCCYNRVRLRRFETFLSETKHFTWSKHYWSVYRRNHRMVNLVQKPVVLKFLGLCSWVRFWSENWFALEPSETAMELHELLWWNHWFVFKSTFDLKLHRWKLGFMWEKSRKNQSFSNREIFNVLLSYLNDDSQECPIQRQTFLCCLLNWVFVRSLILLESPQLTVLNR